MTQLNTLENLNRQIRIADVISTLMTQSTKLIEIVNDNQKEINRLKKESDQLKDNKQRLFEKDDVENELFKGGK